MIIRSVLHHRSVRTLYMRKNPHQNVFFQQVSLRFRVNFIIKRSRFYSFFLLENEKISQKKRCTKNRFFFMLNHLTWEVSTQYTMGIKILITIIPMPTQNTLFYDSLKIRIIVHCKFSKNFGPVPVQING